MAPTTTCFNKGCSEAVTTHLAASLVDGAWGAAGQSPGGWVQHCPHGHSAQKHHQPAPLLSRRSRPRAVGAPPPKQRPSPSVAGLLGGHGHVMPTCCPLSSESGPPVSPFHFLPRGAHRGSPPSSDFLRQCAPRRPAAGSPQNLQKREDRAAEKADPGATGTGLRSGQHSAAHSLRGPAPNAPELHHLGEALGAQARGWGCCRVPTSSWLCSKGEGDSGLSLGGTKSTCAQEGPRGPELAGGECHQHSGSLIRHPRYAVHSSHPEHPEERPAAPRVPTATLTKDQCGQRS